ncbi:TonB-dependent receptor plug domain-containing protein [Candidatus Finniella inopinata]|uniref:TonB-dependent receptor n=1 Tax=Candidatus Finniella inopinata TaxID=1696036 RepID=A0A4Q7DGL5_9PROT|nr:TonB-dependent receptor plug domain-containing protein [Candidatus Finniella inopinata]RZI45812.1 TonB-dependent receptor [Candidatus Finniella inopinata]
MLRDFFKLTNADISSPLPFNGEIARYDGKGLFIAFGLLYLLTSPIYGETLLPALVIKAKKINNASFSNSSSSAANFETQQQTTLTDALKNTPGVHLVQQGGVGKMAQLFVRGANPEHVIIWIDGVQACDPSSPNGAFDFGQLEAESLEKITVLKGPHTASYGSGAVGGVVQLTTKKGTGENHATLVGEAGSHKSYRQNLSFQGEKPSVDFYIQGGHRQIDTPSSVPPANRTLNRQYHPDPYDSQNFTSHCGLKTLQNWRLSLHNRHQRSRSRYANPFDPNPSSQDVTIYDLHSLTAETTDKNRTWQPKIHIGYLQSQRIYGQDQPPFSPRNFFKGKALSFQGHNRLHLNENHNLDVGIDHRQQSYQALIPGITHQEAQSHESSFFVGHNTIPHERVQVDLGGRGHHHRQFKSHATYRAAVTYNHFETNTDLYVAYGTVLHNPSLFQIFDPSSGNHALRPEKGYGWEVGLQQALGRSIRIGTLFFQTRLKDLIAGQQLTPTLYRYNNINRSRTQGVESFVEWEIVSDLKVSMNHVYTSAKDLSTKETLVNRPLHKVSANLQWQMTSDCDGGLGVSYDGKQVNRPRFGTTPRVYTTGPILLRATLNYKPNRPILGYGHQEFFVRVENVLNRHYQQPAGYLQPGVSFYAGFRASV